jgi:hypothetical protein
VTTALDSGTTHETYSDLFKVVGILLRDQLTRQKYEVVACSPHEQRYWRGLALVMRRVDQKSRKERR